MEIKTEYRTRDLAEASILFAKKQRLSRLERKGKVCWFVFENKKVCQEISRQFWFGECLVNGKDYHDAMQTLKNRIFAQAE